MKKRQKAIDGNMGHSKELLRELETGYTNMITTIQKHRDEQVWISMVAQILHVWGEWVETKKHDGLWIFLDGSYWEQIWETGE